MNATAGLSAGSKIDTLQPRRDHSHRKWSSERLAMELTAGHPARPAASAGAGRGSLRYAIWLGPILARVCWGKVSAAHRGFNQVKWSRRGREKIGGCDAVRW